MATFSDILCDDVLRKLAGERYYERGVGYFEEGRVYSLAQFDEHITAEVWGTETYQVHLWLDNDHLYSRCTCPLGVDDLFCKHCVAVGLTWIDEPPPYQVGDAPSKPGTTMQDVRDYLARQERDDLVKLILDKAMEDSPWREHLLMKAAAQQSGGADINTFRRSLRNAIAIGDFVDYWGAASYADGVQSVMDGLDDLLNQGYASDVIELCEEAMSLLDDAINAVDDSDGHLNFILDQVEELHYQACELGNPNPQALAERLFNMELQSGYGFLNNALETYGNILGEVGRETYQDLVDAEWQKLPELSGNEQSGYSYRRSKLNRMKEALVAATGTLEELVEVIAKDLSRPSRYLQIANLYQAQGQIDQAIAWAEQGYQAFVDTQWTGQLGDFLITQYEQQGRLEDAVEIVWQEFNRRPALPTYQKLKQKAEQARSWECWRPKALAHAQHVADHRPQGAQHYHPYLQIGYSLLVDIYLWENDSDQAWQAAQTGGCSQRHWMRLADVRSADHPEEALSVYQPAIEPLLDQTNNQAYEQAIELLLKIKDLQDRLNQTAKFETYVAQLKTTYKRKRNFIKFLRQRGL